MPKCYSSSEIEAVLITLGFIFVSQRGSHQKFKDKNSLICILPANKKEIPTGTFRSILKQMHISLEQFVEVLEKI
jgi:predicted RNA binding protein YcfA (HicA-like mRNA interferase family)